MKVEGQMSSSPSPSPSGRRALLIACLIRLWYSSNIWVKLVNTYLLSNYGFRFPVFLTMCHMTSCALFCHPSFVFLKLVPLQVERRLLSRLFLNFGFLQIQRSFCDEFRCDVRLLDPQHTCLLVRAQLRDLKQFSFSTSEPSDHRFCFGPCDETFRILGS